MQLLFERSEEDGRRLPRPHPGQGAQARARRPAGRCRTWAGAGSTFATDGARPARPATMSISRTASPATTARTASPRADYGRPIPAAVRQRQLSRRPIPPGAQRRGRRALPRRPSSRMIIYPAMDLMGGRCVRLAQGRFDDATVYSADPGRGAGRLRRGRRRPGPMSSISTAPATAQPAPARSDRRARRGSAAASCRSPAASATRDQIARMFDAGVGRVVIGSLAVKQPRPRARLHRRVRRRPDHARARRQPRRRRADGRHRRLDRDVRPHASGTSPRSIPRRGTCWSPTSAATAC